MSNLDDDQYQLLSDRLDFLDGRMDALEDQKERDTDTRQERKNYRLELWLFALVAIEALFEVLLYFRHG